MKILVASCDKNADLFSIFHHCLEKYWPNHPEVIYSTETVINPYYKTIHKKCDIEHWTKRIRETVQAIDDEFILFMVDDIFIQSPVNNDRVLSLTKYIDDTIGSINLQPTGFDKKDVPYKDDIMKRSDEGEFKTSVMCSLWRKDKLLSVLDYDTNPWQFEWDNKHKGYTYLITKNGDYLNWGFSNDNWRFGLHEGKWFRECINFLEKENLNINYSKRGVINLKPCFGIVSYMPSNEVEKKQRQTRLNNLLKQLGSLWPKVPIIIIAQNWGSYSPKIKNKLFKYDYKPLGILQARHTLRERFLDLGFDYLIMFDDDAIIKVDDNSAVNKYMETLNNNPQGFCFIDGKGSSPYTSYADSQLNLCAISRWIYEREPIPNIDPQKSEAFEDRIWSTLLHFKYADKEFKAPAGITCCHFHNPDIDKYGGEVVSTWAGKEAYNWRKMRQNTVDIEKYISNNKKLPNLREFFARKSDGQGIDLVVPYVDSSDKNWQDLFYKYNPNVNREDVDAANRFRGQGDFFRFFFRGVNRYLPWIRTIHLLVQSESQVPAWINRDEVHVVLHKDFIPEQYLPTFNSTTIETFLWNIPGLSEKFIYTNDDVYCLDKMPLTLFFEDEKCVTSFHRSSIVKSTYGSQVNNSYHLVFGTPLGEPLYVSHSFRPYFKSVMKECYNKYYANISKSLTKFRDDCNYTVYMYDLYQLYNGFELNESRIKHVTVNSSLTEKRLLQIFKSENHTVCIQDTSFDTSIYDADWLITLFKKKFEARCKYELPDMNGKLTDEQIRKIEAIVSKFPDSLKSKIRTNLMNTWSL